MKYFAQFDNNGERITSHVADGLPYTEADIQEKYPDAIEITVEDQAFYVTGQYIRGVDGKPVTKPPYVPTTEDRLASIRHQRNALLTESDWTQLPDTPLTPEQKQAWAEYRQALRDFPEKCDPANPVWPEKPLAM